MRRTTKSFSPVLLHDRFKQTKVKTKIINGSPAPVYKGLEAIECLQSIESLTHCIMKTNYDKSIKLICATCGSGDFLAKDEESGKITCTKCNRVYHGGYDELVELNQQVIDDEIENMKDEVRQDIVKDTNAMFKKAGFKLK